MSGSLPGFGMASTYSDYFIEREVADSTPTRVDRNTHQGFTAALPGNHRGAVHFGTKLLSTYLNRSLVVIVDDTGKGKQGEDRVLDIGRAAMAYLIGRNRTKSRTPTRASSISRSRL